MIGVPVLRPSKVPDSISTLSSSFLAVSSLLFPGFLRSNSDCIKASSITKPAGTPSTMHPKAFPCDSPKVVMVNAFPNVFIMLRLLMFLKLFRLLFVVPLFCFYRWQKRWFCFVKQQLFQTLFYGRDQKFL